MKTNVSDDYEEDDSGDGASGEDASNDGDGFKDCSEDPSQVKRMMTTMVAPALPQVMHLVVGLILRMHLGSPARPGVSEQLLSPTCCHEFPLRPVSRFRLLRPLVWLPLLTPHNRGQGTDCWLDHVVLAYHRPAKWVGARGD